MKNVKLVILILGLLVLCSSFTFAVPNITFINQTPSVLDLSNIIGNNLTIIYNISETNFATNKTINHIYSKINNSVDDCTYYTDGTSYCGYMKDYYHDLYNFTELYYFVFDDNDYLPALYTFREDKIEEYEKLTYNSTNSNVYVKIKFYNFSTTKPNSLLEVYAQNRSATSQALRVYYCNSSYVTGNIASINSCTNIHSILATDNYNHTHTVNSKHYLFEIGLNNATGKIGNVVATSTSQIAYRGVSPSSNGWSLKYISNTSSMNSTRVSTSNGATWSNFSGTLDSHIHQFDGTEKLFYFIEGCNTSISCTNSSVRIAQTNASGLPPSSPIITSPLNLTYDDTLTITYLAAISPDGLSISSYNISLLNSDETFNKTIVSNNGALLTYDFDTTTVDDNSYVIKVEACDTSGKCSIGFSEAFSIRNMANLQDIKDDSYSAFNKFNGLIPVIMIVCIILVVLSFGFASRGVDVDIIMKLILGVVFAIVLLVIGSQILFGI